LLASLSEAPYFGMRLHVVGTGIGSSGVRIDGDGHVLREDRSVVAGLHAIGSCAALTSSGNRLQQRLRARPRDHARVPGGQRALRHAGPRGRDADQHARTDGQAVRAPGPPRRETPLEFFGTGATSTARWPAGSAAPTPTSSCHRLPHQPADLPILPVGGQRGGDVRRPRHGQRPDGRSRLHDHAAHDEDNFHHMDRMTVLQATEHVVLAGPPVRRDTGGSR